MKFKEKLFVSELKKINMQIRRGIKTSFLYVSEPYTPMKKTG